MDVRDDTSRSGGRSSPEEPTCNLDILSVSDSDLHSNLATLLNIEALPHDSRTMDQQPSVLPHEVISPPRQPTEGIQTMKRRPSTTLRPVPYWVKLDPAVYGLSEKMKLRARIFAEAVREQLRSAGKLDIATKEIERLRSENAEEVMDSCDSVQSQLVEESKPLAKEYATPNPANVAHLPELSSQQEQAKLPEGFVRSNNAAVECCMSQEFIKQLDRQAKFYYNTVKPLPQKEVIANGLRYMNDEAFVAFNYYIAEKDLSEGLDYKFGELLHHCFSIEEYRKVYSHYNFTIEMKKKDEQC